MSEIYDDDSNKERRRSTLSSTAVDVDDYYSSAAAAPANNDSIRGDINNDNNDVGTHAPSPPLSPLANENSTNDASSDDDDDEDDDEENEDNEEEEYETSYAKLQKLRRKYGASDTNNKNNNNDDAAIAESSNNDNDTDDDDDDDNVTTSPQQQLQQQQQQRRRRRRGGYGSSSNNNNNNNAASVLESLNDNEGTPGAAITTATATTTGNNAEDDNEDSTNAAEMDSWNLDNLDIVDDIMMMMDNDGGEKSNLFLDGDDNDEEEEDDDATRPYDDRSGDDDDNNDNDNDEEMEMEEEDAPATGRGRTTKQKHIIQKEDQGDDASDKVEEDHQQPADHAPSNDGKQDSPTTTDNVNPTNKQVLALVDKLFQAADKDNMTVGGFLGYVAEHFGFKDKKALGKDRKQMIKERLTLLISGKAKDDDDDDNDNEEKEVKKKSKKKKKKKKILEEEDDDDGDLEVEDEEDVGGNDSSSDYEEEAPSKKRTSKKSRKKKKSTGDDDDDSDHSDYSDASLTKKRSSSSKRKKKRSKGSSKKGKMKNHLRDEATKRRLRQMEEARIRQEEMGHLADDKNDDDAAAAAAAAADADSKSKVKSEEEKANAGPQLSEQDRQRAMAIAARFDTNREELRVKREEDRVGLIGKLRQRRLESFTSQEFLEETKKEDTVGVKVDKDNEKKADVKDEGLTLTARASENNEGAGMIELDDDSDDSDEDDLEITAPPPSFEVNAPATKSKPTSMFDSLLSNHGKDAVRRPIVAQKKSKSGASNPRMALRMALREKQVKAGNRWLARELGYKTEVDHIRDCKDVEDKKRKQIFLLEKDAAMREEKNVGREFDNDGEVELHFDNSGGAVDYDEEDDEMAMARELNQLEEASKSEDAAEDRADDANEQNTETVLQRGDVDQSDGFNSDAEGQPSSEGGDALASSPGTKAVPESERTVVTPTASNDTEETSVASQENPESNKPASNANSSESDAAEVSKLVNEPKDVAEDTTEESEFIATSISTEESGPTKPRNSAWQAMLAKEREDLAKQKRRQRKGGNLVDGEAEEEEEEEGIVGLEDFGFGVQKKKGDDDDDVDDAEVDEDDLEHVVDDVSDGEGDEEAGEAARKRLEAKEEKERHKEIMRRMREGYGGRDRGIASGVGGARGMHRFDVLVGADNRDEAKQLGLLNDDELDSDDEGEGKPKKKDDDEEEDEAALLDKMLKERFLQKQNEELLEETFSDDDDDDDEEDGSGENKDGDDDEDKEQDRLAKRFAKRARMNRILEAYEGDSQFSRSRLIDEDESTQNDLKAIKTSLSRKRGNMSLGGRGKDAKENSLNDSSKRQKGISSIEEQSNAPSGSRFLTNESSLSVALIANRNAGRKRKTTFLNGKQNNSYLRKNSTCSSKSVSLNHVVFMAGESQTLSRMDSSSNSFMKSIKSTSVINKSSKQAVSRGSSLWSKVCSKNFKG